MPPNGHEGFEGSDGSGALSLDGTLEEVEAERLVAKERLRVALERLEAERLEVVAAARLEAERRGTGAVSPHQYAPQLMPLEGGRWLNLDPPTTPPDRAPVTALGAFDTSLSPTSLASIHRNSTSRLSSAGDGPEQDEDVVLRI
jgi:hypothetical protein